jgi:hypothetical protein
LNLVKWRFSPALFDFLPVEAFFADFHRQEADASAEVEGGLYHVIVRGNNRRRIFDSPADDGGSGFRALKALNVIARANGPGSSAYH